MPAQSNSGLHLEIGHVLFIDVVGYSKRLLDEQRELQQQLNRIVKETASFRKAEAQNKLVRLPTGDGMALVFFDSAEAPVQCALEISEALRGHSGLQVRMGINTGPVSGVEDVNDRSNIAGAGINIAQRVMDVGDAGHILLSKRAAEDLLQFRQWQPNLHELGEFEVKHGVKVSLVNFYNDKLGNSQIPEKLRQKRKQQATSRRFRLAGLTALVLLVLGVFAVSLILLRRTPPAILLAKSIAVLPFENLSEDKANSFFADGVQDEILTDLSKIADLKVISRTSVMQYKAAAARNVREIAQQLGVAYLLEGSVQRAAGKVRVITQLIDARSDSHVWAKTFDKSLEDVFAVQSEIAETIAQQLHAQILPETKAAIEAKPTSDLVAYDLYLQALQLWHNISTSKDWEGDTHKGINFLDRAVQRDPQFGLAYGLLTELNLNLYNWTDHSIARQERAKTALDQAMRFAAEAPQTYLARWAYYGAVDHDFEAALEMIRHAARLLPGDSDTLNRLSDAAARHGDWAESVRCLERAKELDPSGPNVPNHLKEVYLSLREYAKCDQVADDAIRRFPKAPGYFLLAKLDSAFARGDLKLARERLAAIPKDWDPSAVRSFSAIKLEVADRNYEEANRLIASFDRTKLIAAMISDFAFLEVTVARKQGDNARLPSILLPLREAKTKELSEHPTESVLFEELGVIDAYLGHKDDAIREAEKAVELRPISKDATRGPDRVTNLALVCALTGEHDRAIELLEQVAAIPCGPSYGDLLMPEWDDLRGDPRFEAIVASLKPSDGK